MSSTPNSPVLSERARTVLRLERASDEMRASPETKSSRQSLAPGGNQVPCTHGSRGRWLECLELVVSVSTRHGGTLALALPFASSFRACRSGEWRVRLRSICKSAQIRLTFVFLGSPRTSVSARRGIATTRLPSMEEHLAPERGLE